MRLDFDNDGSVTVDDLKKSMIGLYDFLKNFDIIETTTTIKSKIYTDAIAYMQAELQEDTK
jgi:ribosome-associated protein YbcJ (S4-like RNA binding protein)